MLIGPMKNKFLFGTDYPVISPKDWLADFENIGFDEETKKHILYKNAKNVLNIK